FANNVTQYDSFTPGRSYSAGELPPFSFTLTDFYAKYQFGGMQSGAAREFHADVLVKDQPDSANRKFRIKVNEPLRVAGVTVYLVGHGYAPEFKVRNSVGKVVWQDCAIFLPQDANFTSNGVIKAPDTVPQLGFQGYFLPTVTSDFSQGPRSIFPAPDDPKVFMSAWVGDLGLDSGLPQSVYRLETKNMKRIGIEELMPGETWKLPGKQGTLEFTGFKEWAAFSLARDPGKGWALAFAIFAIAGLTMSLLIPRRRIWLRVSQTSNQSSLCEVGGLAKTQAPGLPAEVQKLSALIRTESQGAVHD
ncbi:MAG: cytochrome c biogenesis protein ResB, partial [Actinomycetales bacterium]|nr:cytochrome c biogenesis protein ResB [Actinomycetales bacterium]